MSTNRRQFPARESQLDDAAVELHVFPDNWRPPITAVVVHARLSPPNDPAGSPGTFHSEHPGGVNFMFMDGSYRFLDNGIPLPIFRAMCTRNNRDDVSYP